MALADIAVAILDQNKLLSNMEDTGISTFVVVDDIGAHLKKAEERRQSQSGDQLEANRDNRIRDNQLLRTLENINAALKSGKLGGGSSPSSKSSGLGLGFMGTAISIAVGSLIGVIQGQITAIKTLLPIKFFEGTRDSIKASIRGMRVGLAMNIELLKASVSEKLASMRTALSNGMEKISKLFSISDDSKIAKAFSAIKSGLSSFGKPFIDAGKLISEFVSGQALGAVDKVGGFFSKIKSFFTGIGSKLGAVGGMIGKVAGVVGKLFAPLAIIMTLFDTVKGAIDGFLEGGIVGGIQGAIEGFFNSLIFGPLDMIKDAIAWVAGAFGFEKTEAALKEFSFTEMFSSILDTLFYPYKWVQEKLTGLISGIPNFFKNEIVSLAPDWAVRLFSGDDEPTIPKPTKLTVPQKNDVFDTIKQNEIALEEAKLRRSSQPVVVSAPTQNTNNVSNSSTAVMGNGGMSMTDSFDPGTRDW